MGIFRRIAGILGFVKDEEEDVNTDNQAPKWGHLQETGLPRRGFSVPVQVTVDRPQAQIRPVLLASSPGDGGVQGLGWYAKRLKIDEDGDVADEFLDEIPPEKETSTEKREGPLRRFQVRNNRIRPVKVKNQVITREGKVQLGVEFQGRLQWV